MTNELTAYSHTSMTIQNTVIPLVEVLLFTEKIAEDNKAAWVTLTVAVSEMLYYILHTDAVYTVHYILLPALVCSIVCKYDKYHAVYYTVT